MEQQRSYINAKRLDDLTHQQRFDWGLHLDRYSDATAVVKKFTDDCINTHGVYLQTHFKRFKRISL